MYMKLVINRIDLLRQADSASLVLGKQSVRVASVGRCASEKRNFLEAEHSQARLYWCSHGMVTALEKDPRMYIG